LVVWFMSSLSSWVRSAGCTRARISWVHKLGYMFSRACYIYLFTHGITSSFLIMQSRWAPSHRPEQMLHAAGESSSFQVC
jgi:hypothetical protein